MNLTRNDWQFGQGGQRQWSFRYRLVFTHGGYQPLLPICEAQRFCEPPYLQVPGRKPALQGLEDLNISFEGGTVTTFKVAEDGKRLILRFWSLLDSPSEGSLKLPPGYASANICDALERPKRRLAINQGRVAFTVDAHGFLTIAFCKKQRLASSKCIGAMMTVGSGYLAAKQ
jgi:alpha-mannosidase